MKWDSDIRAVVNRMIVAASLVIPKPCKTISIKLKAPTVNERILVNK